MFEYPVVYVDIETTGGSYRNSRVLEVAAIRVENGVITNEYSTLLDPETYIPASITRLTGITESAVIGAPTFKDVADELLDVLSGAVFVAHNVRFDYSFLKAEFAAVGLDFTPRLLCTVRLSRFLYADQRGHSLEKLIDRHQIPVLDRHRALEDARAIYYFSQLAFDEHGQVEFDRAVAHQLSSQSLPPHLDKQEVDLISNQPGVYIFRDELNQPLYIGKSITLKKRVLSHFQSTLSREVKIAQQVYHVETIETSSELTALILESKLVKQLQPLHNRRLRRVSLYTIFQKSINDGYACVTLMSGSIDQTSQLQNIYGVYVSRMKAKKQLDELTRTFQLCPKRMGIEKGPGPCFSYSLGRCKGACIGKESEDQYNRRFELALERTKLSDWPFGGSISLPMNESGERVILNQWMIQGFLDEAGNRVFDDTEPSFDLDEYKIIRRFIRENQQFILPYDENYSTEF